MPQALQGIRVLELADRVAAAYCARQFAMWGADVVVLEPEGGSRLRRLAPRVETSGGVESLLWEYVAANKRATALDRACPTGEAFLDLASRADVLVTDWDDRRLARRGVTIDALCDRLRALVVVSVSPFGRDGPYAALAGTELVVQALSGYASLNGAAQGPPLKAPAHILGFACGVSAFVGALAALVPRLATGEGRLVEASELETIAAILPLLRTEYTGVHPERDGGPGTGVRNFRCRDGWATFMPPTAEQRAVMGPVLGIADHEWPESSGDASPRESREARESRDGMIAFLTERTRDRTVDDVFLGLLRSGLVCGKVASSADVVGDAHLAERGFFRALRHPTLGDLKVAGAPARLSVTDMAPLLPAPRLDQQVEVTTLGWRGVVDSVSRPSTAQPEIPPSGAPLAGIRIIDVTQAWIGPFAAMLLADLGADVVKIESHLRPDVWRQWSANPVPVVNVRADQVNSSPNYNSVNRNKRSLCLDLRTDEAKAIFSRLVEDADVLMENFTPRVMDKLGLGYGRLSELNPRLVMTSFSGFGKSGPLSDFKANGTSIEALAGWDHLHRYPGGEPMLMGFYQADAITGFQMAATTLVGLLHQRRTGEGQAVEGSMYEAAAGYLGEVLLEAALGREQTPPGNGDLDLAPNGVYPCQGEDRWIAISVGDDEVWQRLVSVAGIPALAEPRFGRHAGRLERRLDLDALLAEWTRGARAESLMDALQAVGVPAAVVRTTAEVMACPHLVSRGWFRRIAHADLGVHRYNGHPWRFAGALERPDLPPPRLGENSRELLRERLGFSDAEIDGLFERGVSGAVLTKKQET